MSKFMKFWLLIICFLFIFLIIFTDRVKAEVFPYTLYFDLNDSNNAGWTKTTRHYQRNITNAEGWRQYILSMDSTLKGYTNQYDYSYFSATLVYTNLNDGTTISLNNINLNTTCSGYSGVSSGSTGYTIYYQDGSTASISGTTRDVICTDYQTSTYSINGSTTSAFVDTSPYLNLSIRKSGKNVVCESVGNSLYKCPKYNNTDLSYLIFDTYVGGYGGTYTLYLYEYAYFTNDTATQIISNNNSNTQNIINNQNQNSDREYNFISNTTISNENYTNTQTISDNNTNTQTKSVVMNFWLIPLNFFNSIIASFENTCTQVCVGECGSGHDNAWRFVFPCLDIKGFVGNTIYNIVDAFFAIGMIFAFVKRAKNFFINALMLTNDVASEVSVF